MNALFRQPENLSPQASKREIRRELRRVQNALVWYGVRPDEAA